MSSRLAFLASTFAHGVAPTRDKLRRLKSEIRWHTKRNLGPDVLAALTAAMHHIDQADDALGAAIHKARQRSKQEQSE